MPKGANLKKSEDNALSIITHLLGLFIGFLGALIIMLVSKRKEVKNHARYALNWQLSFVIYIIITGIMTIISFITIILIPLAVLFFITIIALSVLNIIFCIIAAIKASEGMLWKYPLAIPFFKFE